jgi:hypothetical protein
LKTKSGKTKMRRNKKTGSNFNLFSEIGSVFFLGIIALLIFRVGLKYELLHVVQKVHEEFLW